MKRLLAVRLAPTAAGLLGLLAGACAGPAAPPHERPVAVATVDVRTLDQPIPDDSYDAACQFGADVVLSASGSYDPAGRRLSYEWRDMVEGQLTPDFTPRTNPMQTSDAASGVNFFTLGVHEVKLTVTASDGRKSSTMLRILVSPCTCGG